jgi:MFS family permease
MMSEQFSDGEQRRNFRLYWMGQSLSMLGDSFSFIALPLLVLDATGSIFKMGLLTATYGVGYFLSGLVSGALVDRVDRRRLMIICDLIRFVLHMMVPLSWWLIGPSLSVLFVVVLFSALFGNAFQVAAITAVASLVEKSKLTEANGRLESTSALCFFIGPMLAGFLTHGFGAQFAIAVDAMSFLVSALVLSFVRFRPVERSREAVSVSSMLRGLQFLWQQPVLRWIMLTIIASNFIANAFNDVIVFQVKKEMGYGDDMVGLVFGFASLGPVLAGMLVARLSKRFGFARSYLGAGFGLAGAMYMAGQANQIVVLIFFVGILCGFQVIRGVNSMSFRQEVTPDALLGRVTSAFWCLISAAGPLGAMVFTKIAHDYGASYTLSLMGILLLVLAFVSWFSPIRGGHYAFESADGLNSAARLTKSTRRTAVKTD